MMISANALIFILVGLMFLYVVSWFKKAVITLLRKKLPLMLTRVCGHNSFRYFWLIGLYTLGVFGKVSCLLIFIPSCNFIPKTCCKRHTEKGSHKFVYFTWYNSGFSF